MAVNIGCIPCKKIFIKSQFEYRYSISGVGHAILSSRSPALGSPVRRKLHSREPKRCLPRVRSLNPCTNCPLWKTPLHLQLTLNEINRYSYLMYGKLASLLVMSVMNSPLKLRSAHNFLANSWNWFLLADKSHSNWLSLQTVCFFKRSSAEAMFSWTDWKIEVSKN